jgi:putative endopeptidase
LIFSETRATLEACAAIFPERRLIVKCLVTATLIGTVGLSAACSTSPPAASPPSGIDVAGMDKSVAPGDDFNAYANGGWIKATAIPADKSSYGAGSLLVDQTRKQTIALIQDPVNAGPGASPDARKIADFYASFMDERGIESKGISPLKPQLDAIAGIADKRALARVIGGTIRADVDPLNATNFQTEHLLGVWIAQGLNDPEHNTPYLLQGGLGLPDRDYYISTSAKMADLRAQYTRHVAAILALAGFPESQARAARIVDLETKMAAVHATRVQSADVSLAQVWKRDALDAKAPGLDW